MAFRLVTALCLLILLYAGFEWGRILWLVHESRTPAARFLIDNPGEGLRLVEFMDYRCGNCQAFHKAVADLRALHPDLVYVARPVAWINEGSETLARLTLAAGLEGKFWEMHDAILERGGEAPESFLRETASLYGLDYDALVKRSQSAEVTALLEDNQTDAARSGVDTVPSVLIGAVYYRAPDPIETAAMRDLLPVLAQARQTR